MIVCVTGDGCHLQREIFAIAMWSGCLSICRCGIEA
jgi:hypothetical protein